MHFLQLGKPATVGTQRGRRNGAVPGGQNLVGHVRIAGARRHAVDLHVLIANCGPVTAFRRSSLAGVASGFRAEIQATKEGR